MRIPAGIAALALVAGCSANPSPVPVQASAADREHLEGRWEGTYESRETGRSGSIVNLDAGRDTATGDVVMIPAERDRRSYSTDRSLPRAPQMAPAEVIPIRFVRVRGDRVMGRLESYRAPECDCQATTTFTGRREGDRITGTYVTEGAGTRGTRGRWEVRLVRAARER
jgi:hypothetical protein